MNIGQKVILICPLSVGNGWGNLTPPPVGSIGVLDSNIDEFNEYDVLFNGYPHPAINDPAWIVHCRSIVPIDENTETEERHEELYA